MWLLGLDHTITYSILKQCVKTLGQNDFFALWAVSPNSHVFSYYILPKSQIVEIYPVKCMFYLSSIVQDRIYLVETLRSGLNTEIFIFYATIVRYIAFCVIQSLTTIKLQNIYTEISFSFLHWVINFTNFYCKMYAVLDVVQCGEFLSHSFLFGLPWYFLLLPSPKSQVSRIGLSFHTFNLKISMKSGSTDYNLSNEHQWTLLFQSCFQFSTKETR